MPCHLSPFTMSRLVSRCTGIAFWRWSSTAFKLVLCWLSIIRWAHLTRHVHRAPIALLQHFVLHILVSSAWSLLPE